VNAAGDRRLQAPGTNAAVLAFPFIILNPKAAP
jgi:hypothetical protein